MALLWWSFGSLSCGLTSICFMVVLPLKCVCNSYATDLLRFSPSSCIQGTTVSPAFGLLLLLTSVCVVLLGPIVESSAWSVLLLPLCSWLLLLYWFCILLMAHLGYLHLTRASLRCANSSLRSSGVVHTVLALWVRVPMKLYLTDRL